MDSAVETGHTILLTRQRDTEIFCLTLDRKGGGRKAADQGLVGLLLGFRLLFVCLFVSCGICWAN